MERMTIMLQQDERKALIALALDERRDPRQQAALIIRRELENLGLLRPAGTCLPQVEARQGAAG